MVSELFVLRLVSLPLRFSLPPFLFFSPSFFILRLSSGILNFARVCMHVYTCNRLRKFPYTRVQLTSVLITSIITNNFYMNFYEL